MSALTRNNVRVSGDGDRAVIFSHGFGCDQDIWRHVAPAFEHDHTVVLLDLVGSGQSDLSAYDETRYSTLQSYADDLLEVCQELGLRNVSYVGHSVSAMIGVLAAAAAPDQFRRLILLGPSARYQDDTGYVGGYTADEINDVLRAIEQDHGSWADAMAPAIMSNAHRPDLAKELAASLGRMDRRVVRSFARTIFLSDHRADLARITVPSLILQSTGDIIAPLVAGEYVHRQISGSRLLMLDATGHCPHLSAPEETILALRSFL